MSYRLGLTAPAADAVRAVATERLERAGRRLRDEHADDPVDAVHGARKDLKKARALLRLARPCLPRATYRGENAALRELGREFSGGRDADVMVETAQALAERFVGRLPQRQFAALSRRLTARAAAARSDNPVDDVAAGLEAANHRAAAWPLEDCGYAALADGAKRAYSRGRDAFAAALAGPTPERLHDWRKRVKDAWYHHRLLADAWPGPLKAYAKELDRLGQTLGHDHDLATLASLLRDDDDAAPPSVEREHVLELIAIRRDELEHEAFRLGRKVYAEKPKAFARRLRRYLRAARVEHEDLQPAG